MKQLLTTLFIVTLINAYGQPSLIGNWRRINPNTNYTTVESKHAQRGDLTIYPDSTFYIQGDTAIRNSTKPGWHSGEEYKGTWKQPDVHHLNLFIDPKQDRMFLPFLIVKLTDEKLVLRFPWASKKDKLSYLVYKRIWKQFQTSSACKFMLPTPGILFALRSVHLKL